MKLPAYTPYDGSSKPFTIGLMPLDTGRWIEPDGDLARYLAEKRGLLAAHRQDVFVAEDDTQAAQEECLGLLADHLCSAYPDRYIRHGDIITAGDTEVDLADAALPPLMRAGLDRKSVV